MAGKRSLTNLHIHTLIAEKGIETLELQLTPKLEPAVKPFTPMAKVDQRRVDRTWKTLAKEPDENLLDAWTAKNLTSFDGNIENCIGSVKLPIGVAGPLRVNGLFAQGDYAIPLATTEAALVASYHRGACIISASGGCTSMLLYQALNRSPAFIFNSLTEAGKFVAWAMAQFETFQDIANATTSHGKLIDVGTTVEANHVYLNFEFTTGDASGQNMVTIATQAVCDFIEKECPVPIKSHYVGRESLRRQKSQLPSLQLRQREKSIGRSQHQSRPTR